MSCPDLIFDYAIVVRKIVLIWFNYNTKLKSVLYLSILIHI